MMPWQQTLRHALRLIALGLVLGGVLYLAYLAMALWP